MHDTVDAVQKCPSPKSCARTAYLKAAAAKAAMVQACRAAAAGNRDAAFADAACACGHRAVAVAAAERADALAAEDDGGGAGRWARYADQHAAAANTYANRAAEAVA